MLSIFTVALNATLFEPSNSIEFPKASESISAADNFPTVIKFFESITIVPSPALI